MRRLLLVLAIIGLPSIAHADAKLHGSWTLSKAWRGHQTAAFPPGLVVKVSLDAKKYVFSVYLKGEKMQSHKGTWRVRGNQVTFRQNGTRHQVTMTYKVKGNSVQVSRPAGHMLFTRLVRKR